MKNLNFIKKIFSSKEIYNILLLFIISALLVSDLFINKKEPASFDEYTHLTNIAMFYKSIKEGGLKVTWTDGFANYGMPIGLIAQQTTSYLGAWFNFLFHNIIFSYNFVAFFGAFLSSLFFYLFLRLHFKWKASFIGAFLFNFAPYRIINLYIRGDLPEFFASVFLPLILIGIYYWIEKKNIWGLIIISISTTLLLLAHPFMIIIYGFVIVPYIIYLCLGKNNLIKSLFLLACSFILGLSLSGYYIVPLFFENKYFYYGLGKNHFLSGQFLTWINYFDPRWFYFYNGDIFTRGHFIKAGLFETVIVILGVFALIKHLIKTRKINIPARVNFLFFIIISSLITIFLTTSYAGFLYQKIDLLSGIQHQWRMLSAFIFLPPMIIAYFVNKYDNKILFIVLILFIAIIRFPQLYGKNYIYYPESRYFFTVYNLHGNVLNTIWTGPTEDYPIKNQKAAIIEGKGTITKSTVKNTKREYSVKAEGAIRMADYTFYFPGWRVYVDQKEIPIQFQYHENRGVITYYLGKGDHQVIVQFTNTKIRKLGNFISLASLVFLLIILFISAKYSKLVNENIYGKKN